MSYDDSVHLFNSSEIYKISNKKESHTKTDMSWTLHRWILLLSKLDKIKEIKSYTLEPD